MTGGSVKLKSEGKSLITAGLPLNMNYPFPLPPSASSLTLTLGEMKRVGIQLVPRCME